MSILDGLFKTPFTGKGGTISWPWLKWFQDVDSRVRNALTVLGQIASGTVIQGRTEGIGTTVLKLNPDGTFSSLDAVHDGTTYQRPLATALTAGQVDLDKVGVVGAVATSKIHDLAVSSPKIIQNVMSNYSNNATVDSIDNGTNATVRVYGPGGPGTSWHQFIGAGVGPEIPAFSGAAAYNTDFNVYYDGAYHITANGSDTLPDGILFSGSLHTVASGGGGGIGGGGGSGGGGGGGGGGRAKQ